MMLHDIVRNVGELNMSSTSIVEEQILEVAD